MEHGPQVAQLCGPLVFEHAQRQPDAVNAAAPPGLAAASQLGSTAIGVATSEGVVLAVEKRVTSPLLVRREVPAAAVGRHPQPAAPWHPGVVARPGVSSGQHASG
jgi:hypothetical protein